jgi:hypothetical protein
MSESCPGCLTSTKGMQIEFEKVKTKAQAYVKENQISVAIYQEGFEFRFIHADIATAGSYRIREILSKHQ